MPTLFPCTHGEAAAPQRSVSGQHRDSIPCGTALSHFYNVPQAHTGVPNSYSCRRATASANSVAHVCVVYCPWPEFREIFSEIWVGPAFEEIFATFGSPFRACGAPQKVAESFRLSDRLRSPDSAPKVNVTGCAPRFCSQIIYTGCAPPVLLPK